MWPLWCEHRQPRGRALAPGPHTQIRQIWEPATSRGALTHLRPPGPSGQEKTLRKTRRCSDAARETLTLAEACAISVFRDGTGTTASTSTHRTAPHRGVARAHQRRPDEDHTWLPGPQRPATPHGTHRDSLSQLGGPVTVKSSPAGSSSTAHSSPADRPVRADTGLTWCGGDEVEDVGKQTHADGCLPESRAATVRS